MNPQEGVGNAQNDHPPPAIRAPGRWKLTLLGVAILLCGVAIGSGGTLIITRNDPNPHGRPAKFIVERMQHDLGLSPQQSEQIQQILRKRFEMLEKIREEQRPRMDEQFRLMQQEVEKVLDKEQARKWREQLEERSHRRGWPHGRERGRPGRPPGPPRGDDRPPGPPEGPPR